MYGLGIALAYGALGLMVVLTGAKVSSERVSKTPEEVPGPSFVMNPPSVPPPPWSAHPGQSGHRDSERHADDPDRDLEQGEGEEEDRR